ncbi:MAG TPA: type II secretion system protein [Candidatus Paceibacterota bacterium]|nr:type II secretion system protein [Verrucomicrobiota bacterium]HRY49747.1 type II secretion system protein [Candidatus Paceibacterota bacterium]HRZ99697.1 type II secretion system protein [Candidatus Paceibacterota bacterium]
MKINTSRKSGFTLVEIMIVVAIIGLLAAIAIPNFVRARQTAQKNACINNLRQIDAAKEQAALEFKQGTGSTISNDTIQQYLKGNTVPVCPANSAVYVPNTVGTDPTCPNSASGHTLAPAAGT